MLKKEFRLSRKEFSVAFRRGRYLSFEDFTIMYYETARARARFGVSCGLKISKKAVARNRVRRWMYEIIRVHYEGILPGDYLVLVKPSILFKEFSQVSSSLVSAFQKVYEKNSHNSN